MVGCRNGNYYDGSSGDGVDRYRGKARCAGTTTDPGGAAYRASGLTQSEFARREGINYTTFCTWAQAERRGGRLPVAPAGGKKRRRPVAAARVPFMEVQLSASSALSCQRHGDDPHAYLKDVLTRLPAMTNRDDLTALLPGSWRPKTAS